MATVQLCAAWLVEYMRMLLTPDLVLQEAAQACTISAHDATQDSSPALDERLCCRSWLAYPHFSPPERFQPFKLTEGLYLNNAWENAASAMEMSAVAAKNCALLIVQHLSKSCMHAAARVLV